jgi:hypothetical protein
MTSPLRSVFSTYTSRPLVWILATAALLLTAVLFYWSLWGTQSSHWTAPDLRRPSPWVFVPNSAVPSYRSPPPVEARTLSLGSREPLPDLRDFPNVCAVVLGHGEVPLSDIQQLAALPRLMSLQVNTIKFPAGGLTLLGEQLEELEIDAGFLNEYEDELPALVHLRLLRTGGNALNARTLAAISRIPHLQQLVIGPVTAAMNHFDADSGSQDAWGRLDLPAAAFQPLMEHPHLREVYANWSPRLKNNHPFMTAIHGYPLYSHSKQHVAIALTFFAMFLWSFLLFLQLAAQFLTPGALLIPRFARPHQEAAGIVLGISGATCAGALLLARIRLLPALAIVMLVFSYSALVAEICAASKAAGRLRHALGLLVLVSVLGPLGFLQIAHARYPWIQGMETWFLEGRYPTFALMVLVAEAGILWLAFSHLPLMGRRETALIPVPEKSALWGNCGGIPSAPLPGWLLWAEPHFASFHYQTDSVWRRVSLLRKGNSYHPIIFLVIYLAAGLLMQVLMNNFIQNRLDSNSSPVIWTPLLVQIPVMMFVMAAMCWFRRRSSLEMEFCRPHDRREFARNLFAALALDLSVALIPGIVLLVLFARLEPGMTPAMLGGLLFCGITFWQAMYAAVSACLVFKRRFPIYILWTFAFLPGLMLAGVMGGIAANGHFPDEDWTIMFFQAAFPFALFVNLLLMGLISLLCRKCAEREWG